MGAFLSGPKSPWYIWTMDPNMLSSYCTQVLHLSEHASMVFPFSGRGTMEGQALAVTG